MANETPNRVHASGTFVGTAAIDPPFTDGAPQDKTFFAAAGAAMSFFAGANANGSVIHRES